MTVSPTEFRAVMIIIVLTLSHHQKHLKIFGDMKNNKEIKHAACYDSAAFAKQNELKINVIINFVRHHVICLRKSLLIGY